MPKPKGTWHDPVWSKVISGIILFALGVVGSYFLKWWPSIGRSVVSVWNFLGAKTPVWNWLLIVSTIWITLTFIEARLASDTAKKRAAPPPYTSDEFFGVRWRWHYAGREITGLHCLCLKCGLQIYFGNASFYDVIPRVASRCDDCGREVGPFDGDYEALESRVIRLIHRNLRDARAKTATGPA